jgi:hypothetical protein
VASSASRRSSSVFFDPPAREPVGTMGVLTDLILADEHEGKRIAESHYSLDEYSGIDVKGIDSVKLSTLHGILTGKTFEELFPQYDPVTEASEEGPWVSCCLTS